MFVLQSQFCPTYSLKGAENKQIREDQIEAVRQLQKYIFTELGPRGQTHR